MDVELEEKKDWAKIRLTLNQKFDYDDSWQRAIKLFENRVNRKFFNPVKLIIDGKALEGEGFTIVTVQCALIEMFAAFRTGRIFNHNRSSTSPKYEYDKSQQMFTSLLRSAKIFKDNFWELNQKNKPVIDKPFSAKEFYTNVRCGLMHEARTKGNWHITATPKNKSVKTEKQFLVLEDGKIKIYRTVLHYRLTEYLTDYLNELREMNNDGNELRKFFARKLDNLFDYQPDSKFDWWN